MSNVNEFLTDYANLLRYLAERSAHNGKHVQGECEGVGTCNKCAMLRKAEEADRLATLPPPLEIPAEVLNL